MQIRKSLAAAALMAATVLGSANLASAHATLVDKTMTANSYAVLTVRVPNEKDTSTVKVQVEIPAGFAISRVKPLYGWNYTTEKSADGKSLTSITWEQGEIKAGEFIDFQFQGKTAAEPGKYSFKVHQTYADGETVSWAGPADADKPAATVELTAGAGTDSHGHGAAETPAPAGDQHAETPAPAATATGGASPVTTFAAYGGLVLGALALVLSLRKK